MYENLKEDSRKSEKSTGKSMKSLKMKENPPHSQGGAEGADQGSTED